MSFHCVFPYKTPKFNLGPFKIKSNGLAAFSGNVNLFGLPKIPFHHIIGSNYSPLPVLWLSPITQWVNDTNAPTPTHQWCCNCRSSHYFAVAGGLAPAMESSSHPNIKTSLSFKVLLRNFHFFVSYHSVPRVHLYPVFHV